MAVLLAQSVAWPAARQSNAGHRLATQAVVPAQPHAVRGAPARRLLSGVPVRQRRGGRAAAAEVQRAVELVDATATAESQQSAWAVLGLGQAMVDFSASVDDAFLTELGLEKGSRKLIGSEERSAVLSRLDGESYKCNAGGSLSNTLVALSRLGAAAGAAAPVGLAGSVGGDALGDFYRSKMRRAGVAFASDPLPDGTTGTVIVLTTPDAQRTMLSYLGTSAELRCDGALRAAAGSTQVLVVEGYLLEQEDTVAAICAAVGEARRAGALVALTCADVGVVRAHGPAFRAVLAAGVDVLFSNAAEAGQLAGCAEAPAAAQVLAQAGGAGLAVVTDGSRGAYLATRAGAFVHALPHWAEEAPVDTCGAGDAYAAGVLHSLLNGATLRHAGAFGSRVASAVISRRGARLAEEEAATLVLAFQELALDAALQCDD